MNKADIEYSKIKLCAFLEEGFLLFNSYPLGGLPLGGEFGFCISLVDSFEW
jgi:hypothetical protein